MPLDTQSHTSITRHGPAGPARAAPAPQRPRAESRAAAPRRPALDPRPRAGPHSAPRIRAGGRAPRGGPPGRGVVLENSEVCTHQTRSAHGLGVETLSREISGPGEEVNLSNGGPESPGKPDVTCF
jgi:hypothetical protein